MFHYFRKKKIAAAIQAIYGNDFYYDNTVLQVRAENGVVFDEINSNYISGVTTSDVVQLAGNYSIDVTTSPGTIANGDHIFNFGTADFTVEFLFHPTAANCQLLDTRPSATNGAYFSIGLTNNYIDVFFNSASHLVNTSVSLNSTAHFAYSRKNGVGKAYLNGLEVLSVADTTNYISNTAARLGWNAISGNKVGFYMDNLRVTKGRGRYKTAFDSNSITFENKSFSNTDTDPLFSAVTFLHKLNNSTTDAFGRVFANSGVTFDSTYKRFGTHAGLFGNNSYLTLSSDLDKFDIADNDFCVEAWVLPTAYGARAINTIVSTNSWTLYINNSGYLCWTTQGRATATATVKKVPVSGYAHVAAVKLSGTVYLYLNGELVGSAAIGAKVYTPTHLTIGSTHAVANDALGSTTAQFFTGYIDEVRITKGFPRYPAAFKLPLNEFPFSQKAIPTATDPLFKNVLGLFSFDNSLINDASGSNTTASNVTFSAIEKKFGTHSASFNGTSSFVRSPVMSVGTGDFTVEGFAFLKNLTSTRILYANSNGWTSSNGMSWWLGTPDTGDLTRIAFGRYGLTSYSLPGILSANTWFHWAITRHQGVVRVYVNGVKVLQVVDTNNLSTPSTATTAVIGNQNTTTQGWDGYIDEVRVTQFHARYIGDTLTVPTVPFVDQYGADYAIDYAHDQYKNNVVLALDFSQPYVYDKTGKRLNSNGGKVSTASTADRGAVYLNGSGEFFGFDWSTDFDFGSGDFTIEAWINPTVNNKINSICAFATDMHLGFWMGSNGKMQYFISSNGTSWNTLAGDVAPLNGAGSITVEPGILHHVAFVRSGTKIYGFVDGEIDLYVDIGAAAVVSRAEALNIGRWGSGTASASFGGFLSKLRITKGVARYTNAFIPKVAY